MKIKINDYINSLSKERGNAITELYETIKESLPKGFEEDFSYGMPGFCVPLSRYPEGYLKRRNEALPFISIASQKNYIAFYHLAFTMNEELKGWFTQEYSKAYTRKLDIGKSCIRFKKTEDIPYDLIRELCSKISVDSWIKMYEQSRK